MINMRELEIAFVGLIQEYMRCPVVRVNQTAKTPDYGYIGYTIIAPMVANQGHYGQYHDARGKQVNQRWSFTCFSDEQEDSQQLALKLHTYLDAVGSIELKDSGIVVQSLTDITSRDTMLTVGYEYRNGFDVTLTLAQVITQDEEINHETIEHVEFYNREEE